MYMISQKDYTDSVENPLTGYSFGYFVLTVKGGAHIGWNPTPCSHKKSAELTHTNWWQDCIHWLSSIEYLHILMGAFTHGCGLTAVSHCVCFCNWREGRMENFLSKALLKSRYNMSTVFSQSSCLVMRLKRSIEFNLTMLPSTNHCIAFDMLINRSLSCYLPWYGS